MNGWKLETNRLFRGARNTYSALKGANEHKGEKHSKGKKDEPLDLEKMLPRNSSEVELSRKFRSETCLMPTFWHQRGICPFHWKYLPESEFALAQHVSDSIEVKLTYIHQKKRLSQLGSRRGLTTPKGTTLVQV